MYQWLIYLFLSISVSGSSATIYAFLGEFHTTKYRSRAIMGASVIFGVTCVLLPVIAWLVINQQWELYIPILDVIYRPWRLFLVVCGLPSLLCALALIRIPESPKFILSQGGQQETIVVLQRIYRTNVGRDRAEREPLQIGTIIEEIESVALRHQQTESKGEWNNLFRSMWNQTAPLFRQPHLKRTFIACGMQFGIYVTSNGMYMWFPEILNRMADFMEHNPGQSMSLCGILEMTKTNLSALHQLSSHNETEMAAKVCTTQLEIATFEHSIVLELLYAIGFALIGLIINRIGKFPILCMFVIFNGFFISNNLIFLSVSVMVGCGIAGIATIYVTVPIVAIYLYVILLLCGLSVPVVNAATVDLYPTNSRAMAICISLMMGRLGSVVGANIVGLLLDNYCQWAFFLSGSSLVCNISVIFIRILFLLIHIFFAHTLV